MKFSKGSVNLVNVFKEYIELRPYKERFFIDQPTLSAHNLIIGQPYLDVGGKGYIRNTACPNEQYVEIEFTKRGWSSSNYFKLEGYVYWGAKNQVYKIEGKWNEVIYLIDLKTGIKEEVWRKKPYPENWEYMYGMNSL